MTGMGQHSQDKILAAAGAPYRRARTWAWLVFWSMAGTSVLYNVYHALVIGHMPWYTGILEGLVPLLLAIGVLEIAAAWKSWEQAVAWIVTAGAMAWSAAATGAVVQPGAPGHVGWPFGILADAAALYAMRFILNGPTADQAVARVSAKIAELTGAAEAERSARAQAEAAHRAETERMAADFDGRLSTVRAELDEVRTALGEARHEAETATARAEALTQKLAGSAKRSAGGTARSRTALKTGSGTGRRTAPDDDLELEAKALKLLATNLDMTGAELGRKLGVTEGYGRKLRRRLTGDRPPESEPDRPEDRAGTASADRGEDRT